MPDSVISSSCGSAWGSWAGCHEYVDGPSGSVKGAEVIGCLNGSQLIETGSTSFTDSVNGVLRLLVAQVPTSS